MAAGPKIPLFKPDETLKFTKPLEVGPGRLQALNAWSDKLTGEEVCHLNASLTEEEVVQRILHRTQTEKLAPEADDHELEMIVRDTLLFGEQDQALKELTRRRTAVTARNFRPKVQQMYQRAAKDVKGWLDKKAVEARESKDKSETGNTKASDKNIEKVYAQLNASMDEK